MTDQDAKALARKLFGLEERVAALSRARQLTSSSVPVTVDGDDGPVTVDVPVGAGISQGVQAGVDSKFAKDLALQLEAELGAAQSELTQALADSASALSEAGLARSEAAGAVADAAQAVADASQAIADALAAAGDASAAAGLASDAMSAAGAAQSTADTARAEATSKSAAAEAAAKAHADAEAEAARLAAVAAASGDASAKAAAAEAAAKAAAALDASAKANAAQAAAEAKAATAQARADAAFSNAAAAATAAGAAQTTADGKNRVWYSSSKPVGTGHKVDDVWFDAANGNRINNWNGSDWVVRPLGTAAIANLAVTNALIANLDAAKITTGVLDAARIGALSITTTHLAANSITTAKIAALAVTAAELAANAVTAVKIAANAITAEKINAGAVTTDKLDALAVTTAKLAAGAVIAEKIAAGAITTAKLAATAIDGMTITGALIRTAATGKRLELSSNFLRGFGASNAYVGMVSPRESQNGGQYFRGVSLGTPRNDNAFFIEEIVGGVGDGTINARVYGNLVVDSLASYGDVKFGSDISGLLPGTPASGRGDGSSCAYEVRAGWVTIWVTLTGNQPAGIVDVWSNLPEHLRPLRNAVGAVFFDAGYTGSGFVRPNGTIGVAQQTGAARPGLQAQFTYPLKSPA